MKQFINVLSAGKVEDGVDMFEGIITVFDGCQC